MLDKVLSLSPEGQGFRSVIGSSVARLYTHRLVCDTLTPNQYFPRQSKFPAGFLV